MFAVTMMTGDGVITAVGGMFAGIVGSAVAVGSAVLMGSVIMVGCKTGVRLAAGIVSDVAVSVGMTMDVGTAAVGTCVGRGGVAGAHPPRPRTVSAAKKNQILLTIFTQNSRNASQIFVPIHIRIIWQ